MALEAGQTVHHWQRLEGENVRWTLVAEDAAGRTTLTQPALAQLRKLAPADWQLEVVDELEHDLAVVEYAALADLLAAIGLVEVIA